MNTPPIVSPQDWEAAREQLLVKEKELTRTRDALAAGPATVGEATAGFGVSKPAITKHLKVLEETGVVTRRIEGRTHRLSLEPDVLSVAADWMDRQRALWTRLFDVVDEYLKEEESK